jgi:hypothetical protein
MGTVATHLVAIDPERLVVDLYVAGHALVTAFRWLRKRRLVKVNSLHLGVGIGHGIQITVTYDAGKRGESKSTPASKPPVLPADSKSPCQRVSKKGMSKD